MDLVVKVKVVGKIAGKDGFNESMYVEILEVYKGIEVKKKITVLGDKGAECRPSIDYFEISELYYLALLQHGGEYEQINCGELYLKIKDGRVWGDPGVRKELPQISGMSEGDFLYKLRKN